MADWSQGWGGLSSVSTHIVMIYTSRFYTMPVFHFLKQTHQARPASHVPKSYDPAFMSVVEAGTSIRGLVTCAVVYLPVILV